MTKEHEYGNYDADMAKAERELLEQVAAAGVPTKHSGRFSGAPHTPEWHCPRDSTHQLEKPARYPEDSPITCVVCGAEAVFGVVEDTKEGR